MIGDGFPLLLARARRGDHGALEALYRDTAPLVTGYLRGRRVPDADDVAGEVFVAMVGGLARFDGDERHFRSWLLSIAHNRMADRRRADGRRRDEPTDPVDLLDAGSDAAPDLEATERIALARLRSADVLAAIDRLTDDQRAVMLLRVLADLSIEEVADLVGKPVTAVKALQRRGRDALVRDLAGGPT